MDYSHMRLWSEKLDQLMLICIKDSEIQNYLDHDQPRADEIPELKSRSNDYRASRDSLKSELIGLWEKISPGQGMYATEMVEAVCSLAWVNRWTGIWDNRRFQECKKSFEQTNAEYIYKTEKISRKNVELRAVYRTELDNICGRMSEDLQKRSSGKAEIAPQMLIPNYNTLSTVLDRLSIEAVKRSHFEGLKGDKNHKPEEINKKIQVQIEISRLLREQLAALMENILKSRTYAYVTEERTFI